MAIDFLIAIDVENAILNGSITKKLTQDPRGTRYERTGQACDGRSVSVICRIVSGEWLRIVTVFALGDESGRKMLVNSATVLSKRRACGFLVIAERISLALTTC